MRPGGSRDRGVRLRPDDVLVVMWTAPRTSEAVAEWMQAPRVHMLKFTLVAANL